MSSDTVISVKNIFKKYEIYSHPFHRIRQFFSHKKYYKEFWALKDITFDVKKGETLGIIGVKGAGKSTLLEIISGTTEPTNGAITKSKKVAALLELGAGFNPDFTGRENIQLNANIMGLSNQEIGQVFDKIVEFAELSEFIDQPVRTYSSGMYVRLAFSILVHIKAEILVIDEALAVGDIKFVQKCMRFLDEFRKRGTLILVSHDLPAIIKLCDRALWLDKGEIKDIGNAKEVGESYLAGIFGSTNIDSVAQTEDKISIANTDLGLIDQRQAFLNHTNLRNDIEVFGFDKNHKSFGRGGVQIYYAALLNESGQKLSWIVGGELVMVDIKCLARRDTHNPIVGFYLKDKLGQNLFGDNSYLSYIDQKIDIKSDSKFGCSFWFRMPILPPGDYSIAVAVAEGTQQNHIQHHWIHDAILLQSHASSNHFGLIGIPMSKIELKL